MNLESKLKAAEVKIVVSYFSHVARKTIFYKLNSFVVYLTAF